MTYISARETADKWGISQRRVAVLCSENRIENAIMIGNMWVIPSNATKPIDARSTRYVEKEDDKVKPFLKWAGGKGQLLKEIEKYYPFSDDSIKKYAEPFVGGGAVLFDILNKYNLNEIYISDINRELINTYITIRDSVNDLIVILEDLQNVYWGLDTDERKEFYLEKRNKYNELKVSQENKTELSALMIFLNRTCFNGLYRVNKKGLFNVPIGSYKKPLICDKKNLIAVSEKLQKVRIVSDDYKNVSEFVDENTFVYFDPPYRPLTTTASFTAYSENVFLDVQQKELAEFVKKMSDKGAKVLVSNSDPKNADSEDDFFDDLYNDYNIQRVDVARNISCNSQSRGNIKELLISNF